MLLGTGEEHDAAAKNGSKTSEGSYQPALPASHHRYHLRRAMEAASRPSESRQGQSDVHGDRSVLCGRRIETK